MMSARSIRLLAVCLTAQLFCFTPTFCQAQVKASQPSTPAKSVLLRHWASGGWQVAESENFRFFHRNQSAVVSRLSTLCETSRTAVSNRWLGKAKPAAWSVKCDVYLYPSGNEYQQRTRYPADSWGFANLEIGQGQVWVRRLDLRSDNEAKLNAVSVHELTHVVLADRFAQRQIPRWADEGIALNSEPAIRQESLRTWLADEIRQGRGYSLPQLLALQQYPQDKYWGDLFYAQSGSLVEFLIAQNSESEAGVIKLVESAQQAGAQPTLRGVPLSRLEAEWKAWLLKTDSAPKVASDRP